MNEVNRLKTVKQHKIGDIVTVQDVRYIVMEYLGSDFDPLFDQTSHVYKIVLFADANEMQQKAETHSHEDEQ